MTRQERLESKGYSIKVCYNNWGGKTVYANNGGRDITGTSVTNIHEKVFGY